VLKRLEIIFTIFGVCSTLFGLLLMFFLDFDHEVEILLIICIAILSFRIVLSLLEKKKN
jgi:Kef-type K+ transport system membrane component KefB